MNGLWNPRRSYTRVFLRDVETQAAVGLHPWERHPEHLTRLIVNVEMFAVAAATGAEGFMDYDPVRNAIVAWPSRSHTDLLETLAEELVTICLTNPLVEACRVSVAKPDIFNEAAGAGVELYRGRDP